MSKNLMKISENHFKLRFGRAQSRTNTLIKNQQDYGIIFCPKVICFPKEYMGKRVEVHLKILEDKDGC